MNVESFTKSKIAKFIVYLMLQEAGYIVIPYCSDDILGRLSQVGIRKNSKISKILFNMPSFIVIDKNKEPRFLKIKFKGKNKSGRNIDWGYRQIIEFWPNTYMIIVTNESPYFYLLEKGVTVPLTKSSVFHINKKTSDKFACLVKKFLPD